MAFGGVSLDECGVMLAGIKVISSKVLGNTIKAAASIDEALQFCENVPQLNSCLRVQRRLPATKRVIIAGAFIGQMENIGGGLIAEFAGHWGCKSTAQ